MTSGSFHSLPISSISVNRETRQRRELRDIESLADSIRARGLINPILIARDSFELIAGERRLAACRALGWTHITCQYQDEIDPIELHLLELEENTKRSNLTWKEEVEAVEAYHNLQKQRNPDWTQEATAKALNQRRETISEQLSVASEMKTNPKIAEADRYSAALNTTKRAIERRVNAVRSSILGEESSDSILNLNFIEWASSYIGPKFNFIHCDFPYGINADKINQGYARLEHGQYEDSPEVYWNLLEALCANLDRFCDPSAHIMFWFSMKFYQPTLDFFAAHSDFIIDPFPLIWLKSDNTGLLPDPQRGPRRIYETALFGRRGDRKIVSPVANAIAAPTATTAHMSEKPVPMLSHFFRMFVDASTSLLDPTCGSGSALRAAIAAGASNYLGLEKDSEFAKRATIELNKVKGL